MRIFDYPSLKNSKWDNEIVNYLSLLHEFKGKQQAYLNDKGDSLERLVEIAKVQSTEASNAIEGIRTTETRLKQLMRQKTSPKNRDEKEIAGYRDALNVVHENFEYIPITPNYILQLHKILFSHTDSAHGGSLKNVQNNISAVDSNGKQFILFTPLSPYETAEAMQNLCDAYNIALGERKVDPLILIPTFIHDFLCIHPFIDGNGRMSRLLTTLLLYRSGYQIGKYISLEAKISATKSSYYDTLSMSQANWHEAKEDATPFIKYLLSTFTAAYRELDDRLNIVGNTDNSSKLVLAAINQVIGRFTKTDIMNLCPSVSERTIQRYLKEYADSGVIEKRGSGRGSYYIRIK